METPDHPQRPAPKKQKKLLMLKTGTTLLCVLLPTQYASAQLPDTHVFANAIEISDAELAKARGKFVAAGEIMNFGVQMVTEWVTASGEKINAAGTLNINMAGFKPVASFHPVISVEKLQPITMGESVQNNNLVSGGNGLEQVTGVVQSIQVAGQHNSIDNAIGVSIRTSASSSEGYSTSSPNQLTTPDGNTAQVQLANNGFSVAVNVPNQGQAMQTIRSAAQGSGQIMQSVRLGGDLNQIRNRINLDIQTQQLQQGTAIDRASVLSALKQLNGVTPF